VAKPTSVLVASWDPCCLSVSDEVPAWDGQLVFFVFSFGHRDEKRRPKFGVDDGSFGGGVWRRHAKDEN
jgi:hypothetical protein